MTLRPTLLALAVLAATATTAKAHDTWFERLPDEVGAVRVALGTGNLYPIFDSGIDARYLTVRGCRSGDGAPTAPIRALRNAASSLVLAPPAGAATCWAELSPFTIDLAPDKIGIYLDEIHAGPALRATWADMQARGLGWKEHYTKHARIELGVPGADATPMAIDLLIDKPAGALPRVGDTLSVRVLRDGKPLAGLPVQLRSEASPLGLWRISDADGRLQVPAITAGRWLLRATDLRLSESRPDEWESRFITLAFQIAPAAASPR